MNIELDTVYREFSVAEWSDFVVASLRDTITRYLHEDGSATDKEYFEAICYWERNIEAKLDELSGRKNHPFMECLVPSPFSIHELVCGSSIYPFICKVTATYVAERHSLVAFPFLYLDIQGKGPTKEIAQADLSSRLHILVQRLLKQSPLEYSADDQKAFQLLTSWIDIPEHKRLSPIELPRIGTVTSVRPFQVKWLSDDESTDIDLSKAPSRLASFEVGDEFEAIVEFNRGTQEFGGILYVGPITSEDEQDSECFEEQDTEPPLTLIDF